MKWQSKCHLLLSHVTRMMTSQRCGTFNARDGNYSWTNRWRKSTNQIHQQRQSRWPSPHGVGQLLVLDLRAEEVGVGGLVAHGGGERADDGVQQLEHLVLVDALPAVTRRLAQRALHGHQQRRQVHEAAHLAEHRARPVALAQHRQQGLENRGEQRRRSTTVYIRGPGNTFWRCFYIFVLKWLFSPTIHNTVTVPLHIYEPPAGNNTAGSEG